MISRPRGRDDRPFVPFEDLRAAVEGERADSLEYRAASVKGNSMGMEDVRRLVADDFGVRCGKGQITLGERGYCGQQGQYAEKCSVNGGSHLQIQVISDASSCLWMKFWRSRAEMARLLCKRRITSS